MRKLVITQLVRHPVVQAGGGLFPDRFELPRLTLLDATSSPAASSTPDALPTAIDQVLLIR